MYTVGMGIGIPEGEITEGHLTGYWRTKYSCVKVNTFEQAKNRMAVLLAEAPGILPDHYSVDDLRRLMMAVLALPFVREEDSESGMFMYSPDNQGTVFIIQYGEFVAPESLGDKVEIEILADHTKCDHDTCRA